MPQTGLNIFRPALSSPAAEQTLDYAMSKTAISSDKPQRHSSGVTFSGAGETSRYDYSALGSITASASRPMSLQSSYSTNDLPTVKNSAGAATNITPVKTYADQQFHNHNANLGRIPPGAASNRQSRDFPLPSVSAEPKREDKVQAMQSLLQASAAPFGPPMTSTADSATLSTSVVPFGSNAAPVTYGYGMQTYNLSSNPTSNQLQTVPGGYNAYPTYASYGRLQDNQTRIVPQRRHPAGNEAVRYDNVPIENYRGKLYELCKDQHGCRYLQKRLEEKHADHTMMIFIETLPYVIELMTGKPVKPRQSVESSRPDLC
jgi:Pumilio-family RNA binding repeat